MDERAIFDGLNEQQTNAVKAVRGPVCILAGAGSGKTTTITRRIANQVATRAFDAHSILAVTFTDKAAGEMRSRLAALGVEGVRARTFHSAALAQLRHFAPEPPGRILPSKATALRQIGNTLPKPYRFRPAGDLATEIEWAKNRRIAPQDYLSSLGKHEPPIPADLMSSVYSRYERGKQERGLIDFEDVLELTIRVFDDGEWVRDEFSARYEAFTVDEYQDVNLLQETLLRAWVGERDNLCVVGDDYQSIYGFTGATPEYLIDMPRRFVGATVVRLEQSYRSTQQVLSLANRVAEHIDGPRKVLRAVRDDGPDPILKGFATPAGETEFIASWIRTLTDGGIPLEEIAVLYRVNFRSEDYEEVLAANGIAYQVKDGAFLSRITARHILSPLARSRSTDVAAEVRKLADRAGYLEDLPDGLGDQEITRQNDLARFVRLADEFDDGESSAADFVADVRGRFGTESEGRGVQLMTLHRAKGLEFEAVLLPRVEDGELPFRRARSADAIEEERRLLYVGLTRAKTYLAITWVNGGRRKASSFIGEVRGAKAAAAVGRTVKVPDRARPTADRSSDIVLDALRRWRKTRAEADEVPAYVVFHDSTLREIAERRPHTVEDLETVSGIGPIKLERYGPEIVATVTRASAS